MNKTYNDYLCGDCKEFFKMPKIKNGFRYCKNDRRTIRIESVACCNYNETDNIVKYRNINKIIKLEPVNGMDKVFSWQCPNHEGSFSYSEEINRQWEHPVDKVFCVECGLYFDIKK